MTKNYKLVIDDEKGRLDKVIAEKITDLSRTKIKACLALLIRIILKSFRYYLHQYLRQLDILAILAYLK